MNNQNLLTTVSDIPLQPASVDVYDSKYRLKAQDGTPVDADIYGTYERVARSLASVEDDPDRWYPEFLWALQNGAIPAGRVTSNAGADEHKTKVSLINCTVSQSIKDSMDGIMIANHKAALTLKAGCGIGYDFSPIRPNGAYVSGAGASTSGPMAFMDVFDKMCFTVASAGARRGAQMGTFDIRHPDVEAFIRAKREDGRLRQFNLSLLITDDFVQAVKEDADWKLIFPLRAGQVAAETIFADWPTDDDTYTYSDTGLVLCEVYKTVKARYLWDLIMKSTYDFAEPGFILIDRVNMMNNNWWCENIRATNPCGEQPLPPNGACLLGSVNLTQFVINPFTKDARFDWDKYRKVVAIFTRMLDNVVELNNLPLPEQQAEIREKRRHGMGYLGLGSALIMLGMVYGDEASVKFTEAVTLELALTGWRVGVDLAREKGMATLLKRSFEVTPRMLAQRPEMVVDGWKVGQRIQGKKLHALYSRYMQQFQEIAPDLISDMARYGCRFTHHSSIAPTGTISLSLANNASNGIEPSFSHSYKRNMIVPGRKTKEQIEVCSFELLAYRAMVNPKADAFSTDPETALPANFVSADNIDPIAHVRIQAAAQRWIDSSISKTVNVPTDFDYESFKDLYMQAYDMGLKGCTTFRFNPAAFAGVLVRDEDLKKTTYQFHLEDGTVIEAAGDDKIIYDGQEHVAANLFEAIKEGFYGKFN